MEPHVDATNLISSLLDSGKYKEAVAVPVDPKYVDDFKDKCWDVVSVLIKKIQDDTIIVKPSLFGACEELLNIIIDASTPEEALLEFIEQIELAKNDAQFGLVLGTLQKLLKKISIKRGNSLEWCLNSISTYMDTIPVPEHQLEGAERLLMDSDANVRRIIKIYSMLPPFYEPFLKELCCMDANKKTKQILVAFLVSLLGKPLIYIDMDPDTNATSEARACCGTIIIDICKLEKNIFNLMEYLCLFATNKKSMSSNTTCDADTYNPYTHKEKINLTTLSGLAYSMFSGHFRIDEYAIPQVYSVEYIVHTLLLSVLHLLNFTEYSPLAKALALCESVLNRMPNGVSHGLLSSSVYFELCKSLTNVAIYSSYEVIRKNAVKVIGFYINKFNYKGRCMLIEYLLGTANHSGMIGYVITLYKNSIDQALKEPVLNESFTGPNLKSMIRKICHLPHGAESDLIELADQIISALNFLRYLSLKDHDNKTGLRECFSEIETDYLDKLRTGLNMGRAHYEVKLKDIEEGRDSGENNPVSINVGGNELDHIPVDKKKEIINSALNAFHLIEGLVARLSECININKMKSLSMACD